MNIRKSAAAPESAERPAMGWTAQARLAAAHNEPIGPADITLPPTITVDQAAADLYDQVGREDAKNPGVDQHTGPARPEQPTAAAVRNASRFTLDRLGERWEMLKAAYETGQLGRVVARPVRLTREITARAWGYWTILIVVVVAGVTAELVYGYRAAALLTLAAGHTPLIGAIAFSLAMNGLAWYAAHLLFASNQNIIRTSGAKMALVAAVIIGILVAVLGLVVGGFDPLQMSTVEGGGATSATPTGPHGRWTLAIAYTLILVIVSAAIAAGHLLILDKNTELKVTLVLDAERNAEKASLNPVQQTALIKSLGEAIIEAIPAAHQAGGQYVATYNGSFRRHAAVELGEMFLDVDYNKQDPEWLPRLRDYLNGLHTKGTGKGASVTRIA